MTKEAAFLFDSHALLKYFQRERGHEKVARVLEQANRAGARKLISAINLGEIIYSVKRAFGDQKKIEILAHIERLGLVVLPVPNALIFQAAELKAQYSISFADCFAVASAMAEGATIVTGDPEFRKVEKLVRVVWIA